MRISDWSSDVCSSDLLLVEEKTETILRMLREGTLDAGLLALPLHDDMLHIEPLFVEPFVLAVPISHALAARSEIRLSDLADERSEERRVGKEGGSTCRSRWAPEH